MRALLVVCPIVLCLAARVALAGPEDAASADALFRSAKEAIERGDVPAACARFAESERLDHATGTMLNLADCEERLGKLSAALGHFREARDRLPAGDFRVGFSDERISKLSARIPRLTIRVAGAGVAGATVQCDGVALGPGSFGASLPVDPGRHRLVLRVPGRADSSVEVTLAEGASASIDLNPGAPLAHGELRDEEQDGHALRTAGVVTGGLGLAGLAAGLTLGVVSKVTYDGATRQCPVVPSDCSPSAVRQAATARDQATASNIAFVAGGALAAAGLTMVLLAPRPKEPASVSAGLAGASMFVEGVW